MANNRSLISWAIIAVLLVVGLAVGWSIWSSLKETRAKLQAQDAKVRELETKDAAMKHYADSLDAMIATLGERQQLLVAEREELQRKLEIVQREYRQTRARLDKMWTAGEINHELDQAFPEWAGQFWEAQRSDGVHAIIAPRLWGAQVAEVIADMKKSEQEGDIRERSLATFEESTQLQDSTIKLLTMKADSLRGAYDNLWAEYQELDKKYRKEVKSHWFKFTPGNILSAGAGFGAGYLVGKN
jgi:chromosome segregation ATPase